MPFDAVFDANTVQPKQSGGAHPVGNKFPFRITDTSAEPVKDKDTGNIKGGKFVVEFTSEVGSIKHNYNLWNESEAARRISNEQLSALCHAVGVFKVDFKNDGVALRGTMGMMDVGFQKGHEPTVEKPEGGYVELKKVYDRNGNEPGKPAQATQQGNGQATGGWSGNGQQAQPQTNQQPNHANQQNGYQPQSGFNPNANGAQPPQSNTGGWSQGGAAEKPPWG